MSRSRDVSPLTRSSVVGGSSQHFSIFVNKIVKNVKLFMDIDFSINWGSSANSKGLFGMGNLAPWCNVGIISPTWGK
jgi:hypothetical protein